MSTFPIYPNLNSGTGFPSLSYSAEQTTMSLATPMDQPLYDHQKAADLAMLDMLSEDDLLAILGYQSSGTHPLHVGGTESVSDVQNDFEFTAAIRSKAPHPRVVHACDHCRRRKTKVSTLSFFYFILADHGGDSVLGISPYARAVRNEARCASGLLLKLPKSDEVGNLTMWGLNTPLDLGRLRRLSWLLGRLIRALCFRIR
jgi:hypothetical protein